MQLYHQTTSFRITKPLLRRLQLLSARVQRPASMIIRDSLERFIDAHERIHASPHQDAWTRA